MVYECDKCTAPLPPGSFFCPKCGDAFEDAVPDDAEVPGRGFSARLPQQSSGQAWPPAPTAGQILYEPPSDLVAVSVAGHLNTAKWMILLGFFCLPIVFIPIAIYHGTQANAKGGAGQGNNTILVAVIAGLVSIALYIAALATRSQS